MPTNETYSQLLSEELAYKIQEAIRYVILPCASLLGIVGNVASIVILARQGFQKCSSILLTALSVSDVLCLVGINNIYGYIHFSYSPTSFRLDETISYLHYILYLAFVFAFTIGSLSAMVIPALITVERIVAINWPLKAPFILTPRRTMCAISSMYIIHVMYFIYKHLIRFDFTQITAKNTTLADLRYIDVRVNCLSSELFLVIGNIVNYLTGIVPICLVSVGCAVIGTQIALISNRRIKLTARQVNLTKNGLSLKTTKTLLSICLLYVICSGHAFAVGYATNMKSIAQDLSLKNLLWSVQDCIFCINGVGDFIIYVGANSNLRKSSTKTFRLKIRSHG